MHVPVCPPEHVGTMFKVMRKNKYVIKLGLLGFHNMFWWSSI